VRKSFGVGVWGISVLHSMDGYESVLLLLMLWNWSLGGVNGNGNTASRVGMMLEYTLA